MHDSADFFSASSKYAKLGIGAVNTEEDACLWLVLLCPKHFVGSPGNLANRCHRWMNLRLT